jgi:hypothetical protein
MDDRHAQFLILFEDACAVAELAGLRIEVQTIKGARIGGLLGGGSLADEIDRTSHDRQNVRIGTLEVAFQDVVTFTVGGPEGLGPP